MARARPSSAVIGQPRCHSRPLRAGAGAEWSVLEAAPPPPRRAGGAEPGPEPLERGRLEGRGDAVAVTAMEAKPADPLLCDSLILWVSGAAVLPPLPLEGSEEAPTAGGFSLPPSLRPALPPSPPAGAAVRVGRARPRLWALPGTRCSRPARGPAAPSRCGCGHWNIPWAQVRLSAETTRQLTALINKCN